MLVHISKDKSSYEIATLNYNNRIYVIAKEQIARFAGADELTITNITYCVNKNMVTFTITLPDKSLVAVFNADTGAYEYILEGQDIVKAVFCTDKVVAVAKKKLPDDTAEIYRLTSKYKSNCWEYRNLGIKKKYITDDADDYIFDLAGNDAFIKIKNPINDTDYFNYVIAEYSLYGLYMFWRDKDIDASECKRNEACMLLELLSGEPLFVDCRTFCNTPQFAAAYLKFIVLGDAAYMMLSEDAKENIFIKCLKKGEYESIPNVDDILNNYIKNGSNKYEINSLFEEMVELCNSVLIQKDEKKAYEALKKAVGVCNTYFEKAIYPKTGYNYRFNVYKIIKKRRNEDGNI